jgi:uncharacterized protein YgbK (DUF1537 family)
MGRTTQQGRQLIGGVPVHLTPFARDPQNPIRDANVAAAIEAPSRRRAGVVGLGAVRDGLGRAVDEARASGAQIIVCDAETDADLERACGACCSAAGHCCWRARPASPAR